MEKITPNIFIFSIMVFKQDIHTQGKIWESFPQKCLCCPLTVDVIDVPQFWMVWEGFVLTSNAWLEQKTRVELIKCML